MSFILGFYEDHHNISLKFKEWKKKFDPHFVLLSPEIDTGLLNRIFHTPQGKNTSIGCLRRKCRGKYLDLRNRNKQEYGNNCATRTSWFVGHILLQAKAVPYTSWRRLGESRYSSYSFSTSALDGGEWSGSLLGRALSPGKGPPAPIEHKAWCAPQPVWTQRLEGKNPLPLPGIEPRSPGHPACSQTLYWLSYPAHPHIIRVVKSRGRRWTGNVARMWAIWTACKIFVWNSEEKDHLELIVLVLVAEWSRAVHLLWSWIRVSVAARVFVLVVLLLTLWSLSSSKCYLRIQSLPQREHHTSPLQRSTG
jgi:hypothetical protein